MIKITKIKYLLIILSIILLACEKPKESGIEVYQVKQQYPDFTKQAELECSYCFDPTKSELYDEPIITESNIEIFNWKSQKVTLTEKGKRKISELEIPLEGLAVAMVLNDKPIYGFWFWNLASSHGCDRVYTYPKFDFEIRFGLPDNNIYGKDPRFDIELKQYLDRKVELKSGY